MLKRGLLAAVLAGMLLPFAALPAFADLICELIDPETGECIIYVPSDPDPDPPGDPGGPGEPDPSPPTACSFAGEEIPCHDEDYGVWFAPQICYLGAPLGAFDPGPDDPFWNAYGGYQEDGAIYFCVNPFMEEHMWTSFHVWLPVPIGEEPVDPEQLAQEAIEAMQLEAGQIGTAPHDAPGHVGLIGLPTWMWISNPAENTTGPITRSASAGGITVTATASLGRIEWDMGDGAVVTCHGPGTPYHEGWSDSPSPDCGHLYESTSANQPGQAWTVTATSFWVIEWSGGGQSGVVELNLERSTQIQIGELQVIVTG